MIQTLPLIQLGCYNENYPYYMALSTDSLFVVDNKYDFVECIIQGKDVVANVLAATDEEMFLETLQLLKDCIKSGRNPYEVYQFET